jgi:hypothetical protein
MDKADRFIGGTILMGIGLGIIAGQILRYSLGLTGTVAVTLTLMGVTWAFSPHRHEMGF